MNEEYDMNLPADADDLSKYGPALFAMKGRGEGFVVPENYFEELTELVVSKTVIPQESGLVVPPNYFEELPGIIGAKTVIPTQSGLTEPQDYFDGLSEIIEAKTILPTESGLTDAGNYFHELGSHLEAQVALESKLPKTEIDVPAGYFEQMESELHVHIALDNIRQDEGFVVPEDYFGNLAERIMFNIGPVQSDNDDLPEDPNVPAGYFEALPEKVIARIESENKTDAGGRVIVFAGWKTYWRPVSIAASVGLLIVFSWIFLANRDNGTGEIGIANYPPVTPDRIIAVPPVIPAVEDSVVNGRQHPDRVASQKPKNPNGIKPKRENEVIMNDEEIIAQSDLMDETMVMDFVAESEVLAPSEEVLNEEMIEYLMNDNTGLEVFDPGN